MRGWADRGKDIPAPVRAAVHERDGGLCRMCGQWCGVPALHHITYRSHGGLHVVDNLVTLGQSPGHDCHLTLAHGPLARQWNELLPQTLTTGAPALALARWAGLPLR